MAECSEIEAGGEVRTIKDATARSGVAANAAAIEEIDTKIPTNASSSNKMATAADIVNFLSTTPSSPSQLPFARKDILSIPDSKAAAITLYDKNQTGISIGFVVGGGINLYWVVNGQITDTQHIG